MTGVAPRASRLDFELYARTGFLAKRELPDGRYVALLPLLYTTAIVIGTVAECHDDRWCFTTLETALHQYETWDPLKEIEPTGWIRHPRSGRRRPGGDAEKEFVDP